MKPLLLTILFVTSTAFAQSFKNPDFIGQLENTQVNVPVYSIKVDRPTVRVDDADRLILSETGDAQAYCRMAFGSNYISHSRGDNRDERFARYEGNDSWGSKKYHSERFIESVKCGPTSGKVEQSLNPSKYDVDGKLSQSESTQSVAAVVVNYPQVRVEGLYLPLSDANLTSRKFCRLGLGLAFVSREVGPALATKFLNDQSVKDFVMDVLPAQVVQSITCANIK